MVRIGVQCANTRNARYKYMLNDSFQTYYLKKLNLDRKNILAILALKNKQNYTENDKL